MKNSKKHVSKKLIVDTTLTLIDKNEGIRDVTLREIANEVGCAHTNLYNYFQSLDEIFWEALGEVLSMMMDYSGLGVMSEQDSEQKLFLTLSNIIDFSMEHTGWYKFIWFDSIGGSPSAQVSKILNKPGEGFSEFIKGINSHISKEKADSISDILHSYLHGELCKWINNRTLIEEKDKEKIRILFNLKYLYKVLIQ